MTQALEAELAQLEQEEQNTPPVEEVAEQPQEEQLEENAAPQEPEAQEPVAENEASESDVDEEAERAQKQAEYRKRLEEKRALEAAKAQPAYQEPAQQEEDDKEFIARLKAQEAERQRQQQYAQALETGKRELAGYEKEYKAVFPEYEEVVAQAHSAAVSRLTMQGMSEEQAKIEVETQKVLLADSAVRQGKDPVEAIHEEAKQINAWIDKLAEERGYQKGAPKTNLQAIREASKPNAMSGGQGALAVKKDYSELEGDEVSGLSMADMLKMSKSGEL